MDDFAPPPRPPAPSPRQVLRLVLPVFAASTLIVVLGVILDLAHHRTIGIVLVVIGAVGGFFLRTALMYRNQQGRRPPS